MKSFLQSQVWADFQTSLGREVFDVNGVKIIKHNLPFNKNWFYIPRGDKDFLSEEFLNKITQIAKKQNSIFLKIELTGEADEIDLTKFNFIKSNNIQPLKTIILDLTQSEEDLLNQMHPKMRYNIKLAQKKEINLRRGIGDYDFNEFWRLMQQTSKRDGFKHYSRAYYEEMLATKGIELFLAVTGNNEVIVANIMIFYENMAIYLHGASSYEYRSLMAAPLLQWYQILEAKKIGCTEYDFWGIDEKRWPGVTRFKRGFGGREIIYPGAYDLIFQPMWYKVYKIAKKFL